MATVTYLEAVRQGMWDEMEKDSRVFLLGQDIGRYGGPFRVTAGFLDRFGPERILDTPISESAMVGCAIGAAMMGLLPVVEMQFIDFIACAFNQIVNGAATTHYRWGQAVPIVVLSSRGGQGRIPVNWDDPFIQGDSLVPHKARILLMLGLTKTNDPRELQRMFNEY